MSSPRPASMLRNGDTYDVIVVGARAAGAATAMLLGRSGLRTALLDRTPFGSDTLSTHALVRGGVLLLSRWGLLDEIVTAGTPAVRRTTFRRGDEDVVISIKPSHGVDALYAPRRTLLDPSLVRAATAAGVEVHDRVAVTDLIVRDGRVAGVRVTAADRGFLELGAPLVIGADGIRSTIAARVGAPFVRVGRHASAVTYGYWSDVVTDGYEWNFRPDACSGIIPTNDGQACVFASASPARIGRGGVALITEVVKHGAPELAERLRAASAPSGTRTWNGHRGFIRRAHGPGWALVGDAAYAEDPISAHGITGALHGAEMLGRAVVDGFGRDSSLDDALGHYDASVERRGAGLFDVVDRIASQDWDDAEIAELLLRLSSAMSDEVEMLAALAPDHVS